MKRWHKISLGVAAITLVARTQAHQLITNPVATRRVSARTPADIHVPYDDAAVVTADGLTLTGWYLPSANTAGPTVIVQHGYKDIREKYLDVSRVFHAHGYGVLIPSVRAHDGSAGDTMTFGINEMKDLDAWFAYLRSRRDVDITRVGIFGVSMGGSLAIDFAARNPGVRAVAADCAFSSIADTIATSVRHFTGLPPFPFAPMILFWVEHDTGLRVSDIDAKKSIAMLSPRPVFIMQGGADTVISPSSGQLLYQAAGEPKTLWFEPALGHAQFFTKLPQAFERRVVAFFDAALAGARTP
jgi:fermentation-respiration switch protein FrsA (DUF1100 family)